MAVTGLEETAASAVPVTTISAKTNRSFKLRRFLSQPNTPAVAYAAAKGGLLAYTRSIATTLALTAASLGLAVRWAGRREL